MDVAKFENLSMSMKSYYGRVEQGQIILLEDVDIPEGSELLITVLEYVPDNQAGAE